MSDTPKTRGEMAAEEFYMQPEPMAFRKDTLAELIDSHRADVAKEAGVKIAEAERRIAETIEFIHDRRKYWDKGDSNIVDEIVQDFDAIAAKLYGTGAAEAAALEYDELAHEAVEHIILIAKERHARVRVLEEAMRAIKLEIDFDDASIRRSQSDDLEENVDELPNAIRLANCIIDATLSGKEPTP